MKAEKKVKDKNESFIQGLLACPVIRLTDDTLQIPEDFFQPFLRFAHYHELLPAIEDFSKIIPYYSSFQPVVSRELAIEKKLIIDRECQKALENAIPFLQMKALAKEVIQSWVADQEEKLAQSHTSHQLSPELIRTIQVKAGNVFQQLNQVQGNEGEILLAAFIKEQQIPTRSMQQLLLYAWYEQRISSESYLFLNAYLKVFRNWDWLHSQSSQESTKSIIQELLTRAVPGALSVYGASQLAIDLFITGGIGAVTATLFPYVLSLLEPNPSYEEFKNKFLIALGRFTEKEKESKYLKAGIAELEQWLVGSTG